MSVNTRVDELRERIDENLTMLIEDFHETLTPQTHGYEDISSQTLNKLEALYKQLRLVRMDLNDPHAEYYKSK